MNNPSFYDKIILVIVLRVISGLYKGRNIKGYDIDGTRPTMDRVKESIFSSIQDYINDSIVLDLFSGSGNLGIEALSNGAKKSYFVDNNKIAIYTIKENINNLKIDNYSIIFDDYMNALKTFKNNNIKFDIVFLDPPYKYNYIDDVISYMIDNDLLNKDALIICEFENSIKIDYKELSIIKEKKYGYKKVIIFKK